MRGYRDENADGSAIWGRTSERACGEIRNGPYDISGAMRKMPVVEGWIAEIRPRHMPGRRSMSGYLFRISSGYPLGILWIEAFICRRTTVSQAGLCGMDARLSVGSVRC